MSDFPNFHSQDLRSAIDASRAAIEGRDKARNRVSADMKALESYLQKVGLKDTFRYPLGKYFDLPEGQEQYLAANLEASGCASGHIVEEAIVWSEDSTGKMRLLHEVSRWEGYVEVDIPGGPFFQDDTTLERESKPLIERPFATRKKVYEQLPTFVRALGDHLAIDHAQEPWAETLDSNFPF